MTISSESNTAGPFAGNGSTTSFPFAFKVFSRAELLFEVTDVDGEVTTKTLDSDYSVSLNADQDASPGGTITYPISGTALATGETAVISTNLPYTQLTDITNAGGFLPQVIEDALDRNVRLMQQQNNLTERSVRVPLGEDLQTLPVASARASRLLSFDAAGNIETVAPASQDASDVAIDLAAGLALVRSDLASTASGKGASLVGVQDSASWFTAVATKTVETVLAWIGKWLWGRDINVFEYLSTAQIASVKAYNFSVDCTVEIQAAMDAAWAQNRDLFLPAGGYKIDAASLVLPGNYPTIDERDKKFRMYGFGYGNPFSRDNTAGTVLKSVSDRPILTTVAIGTLPNAHGTFELDHIRFDGTSTTPVVKLYTTYGNDE